CLSKANIVCGEVTDAEAWDAVFKYFNNNHGKGDVEYTEGETIFIKINCVTAWSGAMPNGNYNGSIEYDTSPQTILALLRQLVNEAGVPEENIYIGDPMADVWNFIYYKINAEFPGINVVSKRNVPNRTRLTSNNDGAIKYSDRGTVLDQLSGAEHSIFDEMMNADYLLNIPTMKGHRWAGTTFFAKNHFGSNTTDGSWQLHKGLMNPDNTGMRYGYNKYRVLTDLMGSDYLGGKTLLFFMDALWATSYEHQKPQKFQTAPFNDDWCSSILLSLDHVAIESVCLDLLQKEFKEKDLSTDPPRFTYVHWDGVDDHLHQAADSSWWPDGIEYDPENDGTIMRSMGVHEHWNNPDDMQYSRNLGTGNGIELVYLPLTTEGAYVAVESIAVTTTSGSETINAEGGTLQMQATVLPENATNKSFAWSVSSTSIATISNTGELTAVSGGTVTVTATSKEYGTDITGTLEIEIDLGSTRIEDKNIQSGINAYPNPVSDYISIQNLTSVANVNILIYDIFGREALIINNYELMTGDSKIDLSRLATNLYILKVTDINNNILYTNNFIKL
ncbi:Ig-like domain-containing protein, partial [Bacteroidota bacterium]